jgi:hypothetical protein
MKFIKHINTPRAAASLSLFSSAEKQTSAEKLLLLPRKAFSISGSSLCFAPNSVITQFSSSVDSLLMCSCLMIEIGYGFIRPCSALLFCGFSLSFPKALPELSSAKVVLILPIFLCVCIREFYFIALNLLFKQEKRFERAGG